MVAYPDKPQPYQLFQKSNSWLPILIQVKELLLQG